jgi:uncharacterized protein (TIGR03435 family)
MPVWLLAIDKKPKLTPHDSQDQNHAPMGLNEHGVLAGSNVSMSYFAFILSRLLDRNVIDRTGLAGSYDLSLEFTLERSVRGPASPSPAEPLPEGPTIFTALREQLGFKLESSKGPVEFLAIERAEKPSAN